MRRLIPLAFSFLIALAASAVPTPYHSNMGDENAGWKIINTVEGTNTFEKTTSVSGTNEESGLAYNHNKDADGVYAAADDWAVSPGIELKAGVRYQIAFYHKPMSMANPSSSYYVNYDVRVAKSDTPEALAAGTQVFDYNTNTDPTVSKYYGGGRSFTRVVKSFTPTEDGTYYFGFHIYAISYNYDSAMLSLTGFDVDDYLTSVTPKAPQEFWSNRFKIAPDRKLEVELNWRLDTLDFNGNLIPEEISYKEVRIYRNDVLAATVPGAPNTWTDTEAQGLTPGKHSYVAEAVFSNGKATRSSATTIDGWVGPVAVNTLPWAMPALGQVEFKKDWLSVIGTTEEASTSGWSKYSTTYIQYRPSNGKPDDAYLILPPFEVKEAGYYELTSSVKFVNSSQLADGLEIYLAKENPTTPASYTNKVGAIMPPNTTQADFFNAFYVAEPGTYTVAIRRYSPKATTTSTINIYKLSLKKSALAPVAITDLKGEVKDEKAVLTWTNPTKANTGADIEKITKIEVIRFNNLQDTVVAATLTTGLEPGAAATYTDVVEKPWVYNYRVVPYHEDGAASSVPMSAFKEPEWIGSKVQTIPYTFDVKLGTHQEIVVPAGKLWIMEKGSCTATGSWGIYSAGFQLPISKNKTMAYRLIAPPMELKKGYYKATIRMKGGYADMDLNAGYMTHDDAARNVMNKAKFTTGNYSTTMRELEPVAVKVDEDGLMDFVISIDGNTPSSGSTGTLFIEKIAFERMPIIPNAATALSVVPAADNALEATINWTNPSTTNVEGAAPEITKVVLYRNNNVIATLTEGMEAGKAASYVDTEIPSAGIYTYKVEVFTADGSNADATVVSPWIGLGKDLPYEAADYSEWTVPAGSAWTAANRLSYNNEEFETNDWVFSPRLTLEEGKYYDIEFTPWVGLGMDPTDLEVHVGNDLNEQAMSVALGTITVENQTESSATPVAFYMHAVAAGPATFEASDYISVPAGIGVIGIKAPIGGTLNIKNFSVKESPVVGVGTIAADSRAVSFDGSDLRFASAAEKVIVADLAGKIIRIATDVDRIDLRDLAKGVYIVRVTIGGRNIPVKIRK